MIKAKGIKNKEKITVIYNNNSFMFNGIGSEQYTDEIIAECKRFHAIGGTYYAEKWDEPLNIAEVLRNYFFDKPTLDIEMSGNDFQELPHEDGVFY
jgi:hypothetical protein